MCSMVRRYKVTGWPTAYDVEKTEYVWAYTAIDAITQAETSGISEVTEVSAAPISGNNPIPEDEMTPDIKAFFEEVAENERLLKEQQG